MNRHDKRDKQSELASNKIVTGVGDTQIIQRLRDKSVSQHKQGQSERTQRQLTVSIGDTQSKYKANTRNNVTKARENMQGATIGDTQSGVPVYTQGSSGHTEDRQSAGDAHGGHFEDSQKTSSDFIRSDGRNYIHQFQVCHEQIERIKQYSSEFKKIREETKRFQTVLNEVIERHETECAKFEANLELLKNAYSELLEENKKHQKKENSHLTDPGYYHMKREGITDPSVKSKTEEQIKTFFNGEYDNIVERQLAKNNDDDFITDKIITEQMQEIYKSVKKDLLGKVCSQIFELFTYDPNKTLSPEEEERLTDISHAYGLLLYHFKKQYRPTLEQTLNDQQITTFQQLFLNMAAVSPPFVLYIPTQFDHSCSTKADMYAACNNKEQNKPHRFHVRNPIIMNTYLGNPCSPGLVCKGSE